MLFIWLFTLFVYFIIVCPFYSCLLIKIGAEDPGDEYQSAESSETDESIGSENEDPQIPDEQVFDDLIDPTAPVSAPIPIPVIAPTALASERKKQKSWKQLFGIGAKDEEEAQAEHREKQSGISKILGLIRNDKSVTQPKPPLSPQDSPLTSQQFTTSSIENENTRSVMKEEEVVKPDVQLPIDISVQMESLFANKKQPSEIVSNYTHNLLFSLISI